MNCYWSISDSLEWVVIVNSSKWYDDLFENWLYWYEKLDLDMEVILIPEDTFTMRKYSNHPSLSIASMGIVDVNEVIQKGFSSCYWLWKIWTSFLHFKIGSWIEKYSVRFENSILRSDDHKLLHFRKMNFMEWIWISWLLASWRL